MTTMMLINETVIHYCFYFNVITGANTHDYLLFMMGLKRKCEDKFFIIVLAFWCVFLLSSYL